MNLKKFLMPHGGSITTDTLSGLTVALALVPEAIAFALVAGVSPFVGLYAAFFMCFITALIGGRPGMISGATGSMAVVMVALVHEYGINMLFATAILTGLIQIVVGMLGLSKFIRMMPKPVMVGFVNGLAIVIFLAQFSQFKITNSEGVSHWLTGQDLNIMIALVLLAMAITHFLPKFTKKIPSALAAIIIVSLIAPILKSNGLHVQEVADMMGGVSTLAFPSLALPNVALSLQTLAIITPYAFILATIGLAESLMTLNLIDAKTQTTGRGSKECLAQGAGNIVSGLFSSMGGCAMIGQSMINVSSGGRGRLSGLVAGACLLFFILFAWPLIKLIPLAALVGVMFMVVIETFEWATFDFIKKIPPFDALLITVVTVVTVVEDLAIAVIVGVILASLNFSWQTSKHIHAKKTQSDHGNINYEIEGLIFFSSTTSFREQFDEDLEAKQVTLDFTKARVCDHSAIDAIYELSLYYKEKNIPVKFKGLSSRCMKLLTKADVKVTPH